MAIVVCYTGSLTDEHRFAMRLDQDFYATIFHKCLNDRSRYANLSLIASLRYKSPFIVVENDNLLSLAQELEDLEQGDPGHQQYHELREVCRKAYVDKWKLIIYGDMSLEL